MPTVEVHAAPATAGLSATFSEARHERRLTLHLDGSHQYPRAAFVPAGSPGRNHVLRSVFRYGPNYIGLLARSRLGKPSGMTLWAAFAPTTIRTPTAPSGELSTELRCRSLLEIAGQFPHAILHVGRLIGIAHHRRAAKRHLPLRLCL